MVEKICKKIGNFIVHCLKLSGYELNMSGKEEIEITPSAINEWLYGEEGVKNG